MRKTKYVRRQPVIGGKCGTIYACALSMGASFSLPLFEASGSFLKRPSRGAIFSFMDLPLDFRTRKK